MLEDAGGGGLGKHDVRAVRRGGDAVGEPQAAGQNIRVPRARPPAEQLAVPGTRKHVQHVGVHGVVPPRPRDGGRDVRGVGEDDVAVGRQVQIISVVDGHQLPVLHHRVGQLDLRLGPFGQLGQTLCVDGVWFGGRGGVGRCTG